VVVVGRLSGQEGRRTLRVDGPPVVVRDRCESDDGADPRTGTVTVTALAIDEPLRLLVPCGGVRPVPRIASGPARKSLTDGAGDALPAVLPAADQAVGDPRRQVVAGLLVVAAAALVGGALLARRRQPDGEGPANPSDGDVEIDSGPHLTLVRVPHESGP
jgi:hypothetical protein